MSTLAWLVAVALAGCGISLQVGLNSKLGEKLSTGIVAALISFVVGGIALLLVAIVQNQWPSGEKLASAPWWAWTGGFLGAAYVATSTLAARPLGGALLVGTGVAGQMVFSTVLDHFGWAGFPEHRVSAGRLLGLLLVCGGVWLLKVF